MKPTFEGYKKAHIWEMGQKINPTLPFLISWLISDIWQLLLVVSNEYKFEYWFHQPNLDVFHAIFFEFPFMIVHKEETN